MNFRKWKLGAMIALGSAALAAGATLVDPGAGWRAFVAAFCVAAVTNFANYLAKHPVDEISFDTTTVQKQNNENKT